MCRPGGTGWVQPGSAQRCGRLLLLVMRHQGGNGAVGMVVPQRAARLLHARGAVGRQLQRRRAYCGRAGCLSSGT